MTDSDINSLLKNFAFNIRKQNKKDYKDKSLKQMYNLLCQKIVKDVFQHQHHFLNLTSPAFSGAQAAIHAKRKTLQKDPPKLIQNATPMTSEEIQQLIDLYDDSQSVFYLEYCICMAWKRRLADNNPNVPNMSWLPGEFNRKNWIQSCLFKNHSRGRLSTC